METIKRGDKGAAVEDVQNRLQLLGYLNIDDVDGVFGDKTVQAVRSFCEHQVEISEKLSSVPGSLEETSAQDEDASISVATAREFGEVDSKVWARLVDASYNLGDRTLYLRMPYFHGHDVSELQTALGALGFFCGTEDGIFGAHTEDALRRFQMNLGLPSDGIAGAMTFAALRNLEHSWSGKGTLHKSGPLGFARAADVLEQNALCLFGTDDFTRSIASRISNLAYATNPSSKIVSADMLSVVPDEEMLIVQISTEAPNDSMPTLIYQDDDGLAKSMPAVIDMARANKDRRIRIVFPEKSWMDAGFERSAQHYAITLLDSLCSAF